MIAVLYSDEAVGCLASVVQQLLVPGGLFILADPAGAVAGVEVVLFAAVSCSATLADALVVQHLLAELLL